jgi:hypothetical protein
VDTMTDRQPLCSSNLHGPPPTKIKQVLFLIIAFYYVYFRSHYYVPTPCFVKRKRQIRSIGSGVD